MKKNKNTAKEKTGIKGVYRIQIVNEDGSIASDSGWHNNTLTNLGIQNYLAGAVFGNASSKQVAYMALGTGTAPATNHTTLDGEVMSSTARVTVSKAFSSRTTSSGSATQYLYGTFTAGFLGTATTLQNIGLYAATNTDDTLFAGNTYTTQSCGTNQAVNATYQIQLG